MGSCLSKKNEQATALNASVLVKKPEATATVVGPPPCRKPGSDAVKVEKEEVKEGPPKKEVFVVKHRRSHERERDVSPLGSVPVVGEACSGGGGVVVRTSSCTKDEVDAILIQCGRLSRSNSSGKVGSSGSRKFSGLKRSYDFDHDQSLEAGGSAGEYGGVKDDDGGDEDEGGEIRRDRSRNRQSSRQQWSSPQGRRRTPSRERDQRSGSRERGTGTSGSGRRVSRSPGRRSESNSNANVGNGANSSNRPAKLVSVPATVSSSGIDKSSNGTETTAVKRISVKRNAGESAAATVATRSAASPRSISPARMNARAANESNNQQQQPSLSRNSSRKAEHSPYRRNPLAEIDPNSLVYPQAVGNKPNSANTNHVNSCNKGLVQKPTTETNNRVAAKEGINKGNNIVSLDDKAKFAKDQKHMEEAVPANASVPPGDESSRPQVVTRSRSARRSRELDINPEALLNDSPSYTTLLLEDIQNFHQKNVPDLVPAFSHPPCLSKAHSILEAVADLNSTTSSNLPFTLSKEKRSAAMVGANLVGKKLPESKDPFVESEIQPSDDLLEPSFHKYVTLRRGGTLPVEDMDEHESSGSNSYIGGSSQQQWTNSASSWEPNSADSTDRWTSKSSTTREGSERRHPAGSANRVEENRRGSSGQRSGIGRGQVGVGKNLQPVPIITAAATLT